MQLLNDFKQYIKDRNLFQSNDMLILGVSGGIDSVVMTELCQRAGFNFVIAHCNFHLRGAESDRDEEFVISLSKQYAAPLFTRHFDTSGYASKNKVSIQVAARDLRYAWFAQLKAYLKNPENPLPENLSTTLISNGSLFFRDKSIGDEKSPATFSNIWVVTAHHANDNIETLLMNFFKGTGIKGLQGILPKQGMVVRPLLFAKKEVLIDFAKENNLIFVEDSSNSSNKYTRNYFRNDWLPAVRNIYPKVEENLVNNIERFREIEILYDQSMFIHRKKLIEFKGNEIHIPVLKLLRATPLKTILFEILRDYGFTAPQTEEVLHILKSETGKYIDSASFRAFKNRKWLIIAPLSLREAHNILVEEGQTSVLFSEGVLHIRHLEKAPAEYVQNSTGSVLIDGGEIVFPLLLRKWKKGDYFYPLGLKNKSGGKPGKKKLAKYFIDRKLSLTDKEKIWVLESNQRIAWVIGERLDERFKITPKTKSFLAIDFTGT